jgi:glucose/arabinose dehydrogenase
MHGDSRKGPWGAPSGARRVLRPVAVAIGVALWVSGVPTAQGAFDCTGVTTSANTALAGVPVVTGLPGRPLLVTSPPGDTGRLFIVEQSGVIILKKRGDPPDTFSSFLDISAKVQASLTNNEMGLLGLAFDPDYGTNGAFYVNYAEGPLNGPWFTVVARYLVSGDPDAADPNSEQRLLRFAQPQNNHNGGQLQFGPDGYLYISTGDGGGAGDQHGTCGNGQSRTTLLGKLLRIDVRGIAPFSRPPDCGGTTAVYMVPSDNPFAAGPGGDCDEIWAYGLRNPWRSVFDAATGDLYIADVGQNCWEEIDYANSLSTGGENYGWRMMEGNHCYNNSTPLKCDPSPATCSGVPPCNDPSFTDPIAEYDHGAGCSITGGLVYRGCLMPNLAGVYFYGDYCSGFVRSMRVVGGIATDARDWTSQLDPGRTLTNSLTGFGVDQQGEPYIVQRGGTILKMLPPLPDLEVAGWNTTAPLLLSTSVWTWEDLAFDTMTPVSFYRVYRGIPGGAFTCVFTTPVPRWAGGDPAIPSTGQLFAYVVTAVGPGGEETKGGDPPVSLLPGTCP